MFNMQQMVKQAQQMQKKVAEEQAKLEKEEFEGASGGGSVKVKITGKYKVLSVSLDKELLVPDDKETLEDLIMVAMQECLTKINNATESAMNGATGGIKLPF